MNEFIHWFSKETWTFIDALITIITVIGVFYGLYKNYRQSQKVEIFFKKKDGEVKRIPISLTRKNATRSEISGLLGMLQKDSKKRHNIDYMTREDYFNDLYKLQEAKISKLYIEVSDEELDQFKL